MESIFLRASSEIELRLWRAEDAQALYDLIDKNRKHLKAWMPWVDATKEVSDLEKNYLNPTLENYSRENFFEFAIWYQGQLAGVIGIHGVDKNNKNTSIGYWLSEDFTGKGIMTQAVSTLLDYLFKKLNLHRVVIRCAVGNDKSCAIPQRLGFKHEGVMREAEWMYDHYKDLNIYSILESEWQG